MGGTGEGAFFSQDPDSRCVCVCVFMSGMFAGVVPKALVLPQVPPAPPSVPVCRVRRAAVRGHGAPPEWTGAGHRGPGRGAQEELVGNSGPHHKAAPKIWAIRRAMAGGTHKRGRPGTRGRQKKLTTVQAQRLFRKRAALLKKAKTEHYVSYGMVSRAARIPAVHETTVGRYLRPFDVMWRRLRL